MPPPPPPPPSTPGGVSGAPARAAGPPSVRRTAAGAVGGGGTVVFSMPPPLPSSAPSTLKTGSVAAAVPPSSSAATPDAGALLDAIESFGSDAGPGARVGSAGASSAAAPRSARPRPPPAPSQPRPHPPPSPSPRPPPSAPAFDPIDFLNRHFLTESALVSALPDLRSTVSDRISRLDESISDAIRRQADLADSTAADVARAKAAIAALHSRVELVQGKARLSERAVLEITRDMKRLDYAKRHLSRTITALKRLHMLLHAVQQLRAASRGSPPDRPYPDYRGAANLIDATRLLLGHFDGYMGSVQRMRDVRDAVGKMRLELREGIVYGFRVVGLGFKVANDKCGNAGAGGKGKKGGAAAAAAAAASASATAGNKAASQADQDGEGKRSESSEGDAVAAAAAPPMPPAVLSDACLVIDALGMPTRREFVDLFCSDHLEAYGELFDPRKASGEGAKGEATASAPKPSFKIKIPTGSSHGGGGASVPASARRLSLGDDDDDSRPAASVNPNPYSLDQVDRRYAWYRRTLRGLFDDRFRSVFPPRWNVPHALTLKFLSATGDHLLLLLAPGRSCRDRDCENVTVLLKALQKTILFEKEMTAWLQREFGTVFLEAGKEDEGAGADDRDHDYVRYHDRDDGRPLGQSAVVGEDGEALEFDEEGRAVAAASAEGIKIKYRRQMREQERERGRGGGMAAAGPPASAHATDSASPLAAAAASSRTGPVPVRPLVGVASSSFDRYMGPYIALEEQNMDEQLVESTADAAVDARGDLPVFTSSTALFVYIKNSITRCTALTRGRTFFLLYRSFQDTLRKYATVLGGKFPPLVPSAGVAVGNININLTGVGVGVGVTAGGAGTGGAGGASAVYRIPAGEEVTVCHVIDTCEYCADTVEALEDLIRDKIEEEYKDKIDMSGEQDAFHDVTAKGLRVLVSGLEQRTDPAFREMSSTAWANLDAVGEESPYVRSMHGAIQPFVATVRGLLPGSHFRNFCDRFAAAFTSAFYGAIVRLKRISESGTQQLLLDVYNLKTLLLKLPVMEKEKKSGSGSGQSGPGSGVSRGAASSPAAGSTIPPAMYTKMVTKQFSRIEMLLKLVGTPTDLLIDVFKVQWEGGSALDLQTVMNLKGMKRNEQASMLEKFGVDPVLAMKGAAVGAAGSSMTEHVQTLQDKTSDVAAKVNSDLSQMRQKVDDFRKAFR